MNHPKVLDNPTGRREATILLADISGFTALSQRMDPEDLRDAMDDWFHLVEEIIVTRGGVIDKFIGDCVVAVFDRNGDRGKDAGTAVDAAIGIREAIAVLTSRRALPGRLGVHVGVNSGTVVAGNVGGRDRRDHTVTGPTVDLASVLMDAAVDGQVVVGIDTYRATAHRYEYRALAGLTAKGSDEPVTGYEVLTSSAADTSSEIPATADDASGRRQATVMFAEIFGVAEASRASTPEQLRETTEAWFRAAEEIIVNRGGVIDKFVGNCVMALFGAPIAREQAARAAVNAAIELKNAVAALDEQRAHAVPLVLRIGINTGLVVAGDIGGRDRRDYTVMGPTVNLAARLLGKSADGQILVGEATYRATVREFDYARIDGLRVKGFDEAVTAYDVRTAAEQVYKARPGAERLGLASPMVGREAEITCVSRLIEQLVDGEGAVASIVGENGMGKSRLLAEVEALPVRKSVQLYEGRSLSMGEGLSYHPFVDLLRRWSGIDSDAPPAKALQQLEAAVSAVWPDADSDAAPVLARVMGVELDDTEGQRLGGIEGEALEKLIHRIVGRLLARIAGQKPTVIVMEDLHWADQSSIGLLKALLPLCRTERILFLLVFRPDYERTGEHVLRFVEEELAAEHTLLRLAPLSPAACNTLIQNLVGSADLPQTTRERIKQHAEGNPFYIEEVLRALLDQGVIVIERGVVRIADKIPDIEIPATIEEVILSRVDRLEEDLKQVVQVASVIGRRFHRKVLLRMLPEGFDVDSAMDELEGRQLCGATARTEGARRREGRRVGDFDYAFKHALVQEAIYGSLLKKTRRSVHAACATAIEELFRDRIAEAYGMLAYHYARAEDLEKAEEYTFRAGEEAANTAASSEALSYFREAYRLYKLRRGDDAEPTTCAILEKNIAQALFNSGALSESIEHFDSALQFFGEWVPKSAAALWSKFIVDMGGFLAKLYMARGGLGRRNRESDRLVVEIMYNRARAENITDATRYFFDTTAAARRLQRIDPASCEQSAEIMATAGAFFAFAGLSIPVARRCLEESGALVQPGRAGDLFSHRAMGTVVEFHAGDWSSRYDIDDELMGRGLRAGRLWGADVYLGMVAERNLRQGRFDEFEIQIAKLRDLQQEYGYDFAASNEYAMTAFALLEQRRLEEARRAMQAYYDLRHEDTLHVLALSGIAKIDVLAGDLDGAAQRLAEAEGIMKDAARMAPFYLGAYRTSRLLLDVARAEAAPTRSTIATAKSSARKALPLAPKIARERVEILRLCARLQRLDGNAERARQFWLQALEHGEAMDVRPELGRTYVDIAEGLGGGARFRERDAAAWLRDAADLFASLGLTADLERVRTVAAVMRVGSDVATEQRSFGAH